MRAKNSLTLIALVFMAGVHGAAVAAEPAKVRTPRGYFALQAADPLVLQGKRLVSDAQLALPQVAGLTIRARWAWLHPSAGKFDFSFLESQVARCRKLGKPYKIRVLTGVACAPEWIGGPWHLGAPVPWSPQLAEHYGALVAELGKRFADDPLLVGVQITGPTFPGGEMHPAPGLESLPGYSDQAMIAAWAASIDAYAKAFPQTACMLSISVKSPVRRYLDQVVAYGREKLGERFTLQHNALKASTHPQARHHVFIASQGRQGVRIGFEMVGPASRNPRRFGSAEVMDGVNRGQAAGGVFFDVYPPDLDKLQ